MTKPLNEGTPQQIGEVTNIDRMDSIDRAKLEPRVKLQLLAAEARHKYSRDPRSGGFAIVGRPRVLLQMLIDLAVGPFSSDVRLHKAVVIGATNGDIVGWWQDVPIMVRSTTVGNALVCVPLDKIPPSSNVDRQRAGQLRINAHSGTLSRLKES